MFRLSFLLEDETLADYLLNEVPIGKDVIIFDEDNGISYVLTVDLDSIDIKTLYLRQRLAKKSKRINVGFAQLAVLIKDARVVQA